jgi:C_GCAxxG_C_C family probable redox protein
MEDTMYHGQDETMLIKAIENTARLYADKRRGCCRNVVGALQTYLGFGGAEAFRAAVPMGGGIARSGGTCGALLGALMAIGLACCHDEPDVDYNSSSYEETMQCSSQIYDLFLKEFGSVLCRDIQNNLFGKSYNMKVAEEVSELNSLNRAVGFPVIAAAARLAATLILERGFSNSSDTLR